MGDAGSVAGPLLAGFSFTLFVLLLPTLSPEKTVVATPHGLRVVSESPGFSAAPEVAAALVLLAGLLFVFSVQAAAFVRQHTHEPADLLQWYPEYFPKGDLERQAAAGLPGWNEGPWQAWNVGDQWIAGWARKFLYAEVQVANRWADWMRRLYQGGILLLLAGLTVLVWPPPGDGDFGRWLIVGIGVAGATAEAGWMLTLFFKELARD